MKIVKKRMFAFLLCVVLCLTVLPVCAFAGEGLAASGAVTSPLTGDESNVPLYVVLAVGSAGAAYVIYRVLKKRGDKR